MAALREAKLSDPKLFNGNLMHVYEVRPRKDHRGVDLIPMRCPSVACGTWKFRSRSRDAVIRVYDDAGNVIGTHEHAGPGARLELAASRQGANFFVDLDVPKCLKWKRKLNQKEK